MSTRPIPWLLLAVDRADRQHGGNDGYDDDHAAYYSYDSTVPNYRNVAQGDVVVLWDKYTLLGASVISDLVEGHATKVRRSCPLCGLASLKARKTKQPIWKCFKCGECFDQPSEESARVRTFRAHYVDGWMDLTGTLSAAEVRRVCQEPKSQLSMRQLNWPAFVRAVERAGGPVEKLVQLAALPVG